MKLQLTDFKASVGGLFTTAIILALGRFFIRAKTYHKFLIDDAILLFACLTLTASVCLTYINVASNIYDHDYVNQVIEDEKLQAINTVLFWATIFAVKFSFLAFFKGLISQVDNLERWWWLVFVVTIPSAAICMCVNFIACPYIGFDIIKCADNEHIDKELALLKATTILDIVTDILSQSAPITYPVSEANNLSSHLHPIGPSLACQDVQASQSRPRRGALSQHLHDHCEPRQGRLGLHPRNAPDRSPMGPILGRNRSLRRGHHGLS